MNIPTVAELFPAFRRSGHAGFALEILQTRGIFEPWCGLGEDGEVSRAAGKAFVRKLNESSADNWRALLPEWFRRIGKDEPHPFALMRDIQIENGWRIHGAALGLGGVHVLGGYHSKIDPTVRLVRPLMLDRDVTIRASSRLTGPTIVGRGVKIGAHVSVSRSVVCPGAEIRSGAIIGDAVIGHGVHIGAGVVLQSEPDNCSSEVVINDFRERRQPEIRTGRSVLGPIIGDFCRVLGSLHAGTVLLPETVVPMGVDLPAGIYNAKLVEEYARIAHTRARKCLAEARRLIQRPRKGR